MDGGWILEEGAKEVASLLIGIVPSCFKGVAKPLIRRYSACMRSKNIVQSMLENGFLDPKKHNPNDYITHTTNAAKRLEEALKGVKDHESVAELVASMFDTGFCDAGEQSDPTEWVMFAETAIAELKVV